jgi:GDPmannose 4,6-dehydratase
MRALIAGVTGQDGSLLAKFLLAKGYEVYGTSRDAQMSLFSNLKSLGISEEVEKLSMSPIDFRSVHQALSRVEPDEIYYLAGQTSVGLSFEQPMEAFESITVGTMNLLEAIRLSGREIRFYNAGSSEVFGDTVDEPATEETPFRPRSPYGIAKAASIWAVANYREAYKLKACSGILFNHESPLRPRRFVTKKVVSAAVRIADGSNEKLKLGNLNVHRDWGWAEEYVEAMWKMLQLEEPEDLVIATGETNSLRDFVNEAFRAVGLKAADHIVKDSGLYRKTDITTSRANPKKADRLIGWKAKYSMVDVVSMMIETQRPPRLQRRDPFQS